MTQTATKHEQIVKALAKAEPKFVNLASEKNTPVVYKEEARHADGLIRKNDLVYKTALNNPKSLMNALVNVAAIGLTLNPALSLAYLVPRDGAICLDISYRGLLQIATDTGSIKWCKAEIVRQNDTFVYKGVCEKPEHIVDIFGGNRGDAVGVYCIAKTNDGDYLVDTMDMDAIMEVRNTSKSKDSKYSPWTTFPEEMYKKTIIKRASKTWPRTNQNRLHEAIDYLNKHEGLKEEYVNPEDFEVSSAMKKYFHSLIDGERSLEMFILADELKDPQWEKLLDSFPKGKKTKGKEAAFHLNSEGRKEFGCLYDEWARCALDDNEALKSELQDDLPEHGITMLQERYDHQYGES